MAIVLFAADDGVHGPELWETDTVSGETTLVKDINPNNGSISPGSNISDLVTINGIAYFSASDGSQQLMWRSDGTTAGTFAITTLNNGAAPLDITGVGGSVYFVGGFAGQNELFTTDGTTAGTRLVSTVSVSQLTALNGKLVFEGTDASHGKELWVSDGTTAGTQLLKDIQPGPQGSNIDNFTVIGNELYFTATINGQGSFWVTDGTAAGTIMESGLGGLPASLDNKLYFVGSGPAGQGLYASDGTVAGETLITGLDLVTSKLFRVGDKLIFSAFDTNVQEHIYSSDGTAAGTQVLPTPGDFLRPVVAGSQLFFVSSDPAHADELWVTDGSATGTHLVKDINPGPNGSNITSLSAYGSYAIFSANDGVHGPELWISDGTANGTRLFSDINQTLNLFPSLNIGSIVQAGTNTFFIGTDSVFGAELYVTDGTAGDAPILTFLNPGLPTELTAFGSNVIFQAIDGLNGPQLYASDGTVAGTVAITSKAIGAPNGDFTIFDGKLYFSGFSSTTFSDGLYASDGTPGGETLVAALAIQTPLFVLNGMLTFFVGSGLYVSDGTSAGTHLVGGSSSMSFVGPGVAANGKLYFLATGADNDRELWTTDGTDAGTHVTVDINPGTAGANISGLTPFGSGVIFQATDPSHGAEVWVSDGTTVGTHLLADINQTTDPRASLNPSDITVAGSQLFFEGADPVAGNELFVSDGTTAGTHIVADLNVGPNGSNPGNLTAFGSRLVFTANDGIHGQQLYITDGLAADTFAISSSAIGAPIISSPVAATVFNGEVFFEGTSAGVFGLYGSDGSPAGETLIKSNLQISSAFYQIGGKLAFVANGAAGQGLYLSDGTSAGTILAAAMNFSNASSAVVAGANLFFSTTGGELWVSDGSVAGTHLLSSALNNLPQFSTLSNLTALGSKLLLTAIDATHGTELYVSDGTVSGTTLLDDINPGPGSGVAGQPFTVVGGKAYFVANDGVHGSELWATDGAAAGTAMVTDITPQGVNGGNTSFGSFAAFDGKLYFSATRGAQSALWTTDGTAAGTQIVSSLFDGDSPTDFVVAGPKLFYVGSSFGNIEGLYVTDGTAAGTTLLSASPTTLIVPTDLTALGGKILFSAFDANGFELWSSDGTVAGTHRVSDTESPNSSSPSQFTIAAGKAFFSATDGVHGDELFVTDGTTTNLVKDINVGAGDSSPAFLTAFNNKLYFAASDGARPGLWVSDGTAAGTSMVLGGVASAHAIADLTVVSPSELFFTESDLTHGLGLFVTDGTAAGTRFLTSEIAFDLSVSNGKLYFSGSDETNGTELWVSDGTVAGTHMVSNTNVPNGSNPNTFTVLSNGLTLTGTAGADVLVGGHGDDVLTGGGGGDSLTGGVGEDVFRYVSASDSTSSAFDIIQDFQTGVDKIDLQDVTPDQVSVVRSNGVSFVFVSSPSGSMTIAANGDVNGTDFLTGGTNHGGVYLIADNNGDVLIGSSAGDPIQGGSGNDTITGGGGGDAIFGGAGTNTFLYQAYTDSGPTAADGIFDFKTGIDRIDLTALNTTAVSLIRSGGSTFLFASGPNGELLQINSAFHDLNGADILTGSTHGVYLIGDNAGDTLIGSANSDPIQGGSGNDLIIGGGGGDALFGGGGANTFKYLAASDSTATASDSIFDFKAGIDKIDLSAVRESSTDVFGILSQSGSSFLFVKLDPGQADEHDMTIILNGTPLITANDIIWGTAPTHAASAVSSHPIGETMPTAKTTGSSDGSVTHSLLDSGGHLTVADVMPTQSHLADPFEHYFLGPLGQHVAMLLPA